jgi:predicted transcriptional regulator
METIHLKPERKTQLEDYARRHGPDPAVALDDVLAGVLEWESLDYQETVEGIRRGVEDVDAGRTRPAAEFLSEVRQEICSGRYETPDQLIAEAIRSFFDERDRGQRKLDSLRRIGQAVDVAGLYEKVLIPRPE